MSLMMGMNGWVHYPRNPDKFEFDEEVSPVFENMAQRSIPMYQETHRLHARMARQHHFKTDRKLRILDVGTSTGMFFQHLCRSAGTPCDIRPPFISSAIGTDISPSMLELLRKELEWVQALPLPAEQLSTLQDKSFDIINISYVMQFIEPPSRQGIYNSLYDLLDDGGLLFVSEKHLPSVHADHEIDQHMTEQYVDFRIANGYTRREIDAKTKALKGSMWPNTFNETVDMLTAAGFQQVTETARWLHFGSMVAAKE